MVKLLYSILGPNVDNGVTWITDTQVYEFDGMTVTELAEKIDALAFLDGTPVNLQLGEARNLDGVVTTTGYILMNRFKTSRMDDWVTKIREMNSITKTNVDTDAYVERKKRTCSLMQRSIALADAGREDKVISAFEAKYPTMTAEFRKAWAEGILPVHIKCTSGAYAEAGREYFACFGCAVYWDGCTYLDDRAALQKWDKTHLKHDTWIIGLLRPATEGYGHNSVYI